MAYSLHSTSRACALAAICAALLGWSPLPRLSAQARSPDSTPKPRQIAPAMSWVYADWLTRQERQREEQPDRLVSSLNIPRGATVVDLGAGVGYFTWRLAHKVGRSGKSPCASVASKPSRRSPQRPRTRACRKPWQT